MPKRTVLQTFDSGRFNRDEHLNWGIDIAHARAELLKALLGGTQVVMTANDVGDSPALQALLLEFMIMGEDQITRHNAKGVGRFEPFIIGLEEPYRNYRGTRGYPAFVRKYRDREVAKAQAGQQSGDWRAIGHNSEDTNLSEFEMLCAMAATLLGEPDPLVARLKHQKPGVWEYVRFIRRTYSQDCVPEAEPLYCKGSPFTGEGAISFDEAIIDLAYEGGQATGDEERTFKIVSTVESMRASGNMPRSRREWTKQFARFGDDADTVRDFVDFALFNRVFSTFEATQPSFFTQDRDLDPEVNRFTLMSMIPRELFHTFNQEILPAAPRLTPGIDSDIWKEMLPILLSDEFNRSLRRMRERIARAEALPIEQRGQAIPDALEDHIERLASITKRVNVIRSGNRIIDVVVQPTPLDRWALPGSAGVAGVGGMLGVAYFQQINSWEAAAFEIGKTIALPAAFWAIDRLRRPKKAIGVALADNLVVEDERINWRINLSD